MPEYEFVIYEELEEGRVVRILLNRPDTRNAQNRGMLVELDDAFRRAEEDDTVRVVILGGVVICCVPRPMVLRRTLEAAQPPGNLVRTGRRPSCRHGLALPSAARRGIPQVRGSGGRVSAT